MKLTLITALTALLGAEVILAGPIELIPRASRRAEKALRRKGLNVIQPDNDTNSTQAPYSTNWAGAVLVGTGYQSVTGTFTVPTPKMPAGGSPDTKYEASAWVGIDGSTCKTAILQTGINFAVQGDTVSFQPWYEWWPDLSHPFSDFVVNAGDQIKLTAEASSTSAGSVTIQNLSTGEEVSQSFSGETDLLCETNAEWIVEDFSRGGKLVPFVDFGTVTFTEASATTAEGTVGLSGAEITNIRQDEVVLTSASILGSSSLTVSRL